MLKKKSHRALFSAQSQAGCRQKDVERVIPIMKERGISEAIARNLAVMSLIFKRSFEISTQLSAMIAFGYFVIYHITFYWLFL